MTALYQPDVLIRSNEIVAPPVQRACEDQSFELPTGIYAAMAALFAGFLAVLAVGFAAPGLAVPMAINFAFLTAFFAVPAIIVRAAPAGSRAMQMSDFLRKGIATATGRVSGGEAMVLILLLPALIFCWALAIVAINALV